MSAITISVLTITYLEVVSLFLFVIQRTATPNLVTQTRDKQCKQTSSGRRADPLRLWKLVANKERKDRTLTTWQRKKKETTRTQLDQEQNQLKAVCFSCTVINTARGRYPNPTVHTMIITPLDSYPKSSSIDLKKNLQFGFFRTFLKSARVTLSAGTESFTRYGVSWSSRWQMILVSPISDCGCGSKAGRGHQAEGLAGSLSGPYSPLRWRRRRLSRGSPVSFWFVNSQLSVLVCLRVLSQ